VKSGKEEQCYMLLTSLQSSILNAQTHDWTQKLNREDYGVDKYWVPLVVVQESTLLKTMNTVAFT
jgi:hypothetical protein